MRNILPYTWIVGQKKIKRALELSYIAPRIGGVLISGKRGTAKSTIVRAFASMMYKDLPVTIPINATEDRVVGGWEVTRLVRGEMKKKKGLLEEADGKLLYIDEVNLLDDHIINIILDVTSTGKLVIQREGLDEQLDVQTTLVGTMNPEEGGLRPQLLDRFGLMTGVDEEMNEGERREILARVLAFDKALRIEKSGKVADILVNAYSETKALQKNIEQARSAFYDVELDDETAEACAKVANGFQVEGYRSDYLLAIAACAYAARQGELVAKVTHLREIADLVLRHRLPGAYQLSYAQWGEPEEQRLAELLECV